MSQHVVSAQPIVRITFDVGTGHIEVDNCPRFADRAVMDYLLAEVRRRVEAAWKQQEDSGLVL